MSPASSTTTPATLVKDTTQTPTTARRPQAGPAPARPRSRRAPAGALTRRQKAALAQLATAAWEIQLDLGVEEIPEGVSRTAALNAWRRREQLQATGIESLTQATQAHFRPLKAHFLTLAGREAEALGLHLRSGPTRDHGQPGDTHEEREKWRHLILRELQEHGRRMAAEGRDDVITAAYVESIARAKHRRRLDSLTARDLERLLYTTRNRIAAREGRGDPAKRNQSQRRRHP